VHESIYREAEVMHPLLRQAGDSVVALLRAQRGLKFAQSWRDFRVSACAVTFLDDELAVSYIHGVNRKPQANGPEDLHAEEAVLADTVNIAREPISVLAIVADVQPDESTDLATSTLVPCYRRCLPGLEASEHMVPHSLVLSATPDLSCVQYYDLSTLRRAYDAHQPELLSTVNFETPNAEDRLEWREKLIRPIGNRALDLIMQTPPQAYLGLPL
jgi:hypothetical protein